jgi:adenosylcobinamide-GDP ribazoletransferase
VTFSISSNTGTKQKTAMSDTLPETNGETGKFRPFAELLFSLRFLTRLPIPFTRTLDPPLLSHSMRFFGFAGALIGALNGVVLIGLHALHLPSLMAATLTCAFGALVTGALHEDGLSDMMDGLFGGKSREQRLLIMRDSRIGNYGATALILAMLARVSAYEALINLPISTAILLLAAAGAFSRAMVVDLLWATKSARGDGLSVFAGRPGRNSALFAIITAGALTIFAGLQIKNASGVVAILAACVITAVLRRLAVRMIGGQTGDVCGAVQVLSEISMLATFSAMIG